MRRGRVGQWNLAVDAYAQRVGRVREKVRGHALQDHGGGDAQIDSLGKHDQPIDGSDRELGI